MHLLIRADASTQIGTGHVMRCLALAQACLAEGGQAHFLMDSEGASLAQRILDEGVQVSYLSTPGGSEADAQQTIALANSQQADWVVVDGYHFGAEYQKWLKDAGLKVLAIDDYGHASHYWADIVLNQNITAEEASYSSREPYTQLLLGTRYALLRKEFWPWHNWQRQISPMASKVLVTLGGSDPDNVTLAVVQALQNAEIDGLEAVVVVGSSNPHYGELAQAVKGWEKSITLRQNVTNMPELMAWADLAVTAGGSTCWETAFMKLPSLILVTADNQAAIAEHLADLGAVMSAGPAKYLSVNLLSEYLTKYLKQHELRLGISKKTGDLVDEYGYDRLMMILQGNPIRLRSIEKKDCPLIWQWANEPVARASSFSPEPIAWQEHVQWFESRLNSESCRMYLALNEQDQAVGLVRYEINSGGEAIVSINLDKKHRGKGYGNMIVETSELRLLRELKTKRISAYIKKDNSASMKIFLRAGFKLAEEFSAQGVNHIQLDTVHMIKESPKFILESL